MEAGFKIDDKDFISLVQGEDLAATLRVFNKDTLAPLDLDGASLSLDLPAENGIPVVLRSTATLVLGSVDQTDDEISIANHGLANGELVTAQEVGTLPTGLSNGGSYYVKVIDEDTIQLCSDSALETVVDLSGAGSGSNTLTRTSLLAHGDPNLGRISITIKKEVAAALKAGSRRTLELAYVLSGTTKVIQLEKAMTILEQAL